MHHLGCFTFFFPTLSEEALLELSYKKPKIYMNYNDLGISGVMDQQTFDKLFCFFNKNGHYEVRCTIRYRVPGYRDSFFIDYDVGSKKITNVLKIHQAF